MKKLFNFILIFIITFTVCSCTNLYSDGGEVVVSGDNVYLLLNAGEKKAVDFDEVTRECMGDWVDVETINNIELVSGDKNIAKVSGTEIMGVETGQTYVTVKFNSDSNGNLSFDIYVFVVNPDTMTEINSAQDLADIGNDLDGNYILNSDIDLQDCGDWSPIAQYFEDGSVKSGFSGSFINPYGYKIKNLTIESLNDVPTNTNYFGIGLFDTLSFAYVDGLILENVNIDVSNFDNDSEINLSVGAISGYALRSILRNCTIDGMVIKSQYSDGIVGLYTDSSYGFSENNVFLED